MTRALTILLALALAGHAAAGGGGGYRPPPERWSRLDRHGNYQPVRAGAERGEGAGQGVMAAGW